MEAGGYQVRKLPPTPFVCDRATSASGANIFPVVEALDANMILSSAVRSNKFISLQRLSNDHPQQERRKASGIWNKPEEELGASLEALMTLRSYLNKDAADLWAQNTWWRSTELLIFAVAESGNYRWFLCFISLLYWYRLSTGDEFRSHSWQTLHQDILGAEDRQSQSHDRSRRRQNEEERSHKVSPAHQKLLYFP